jgi:hypothetical protein
MMIPVTLPLRMGQHILAEVDCSLEVGIFGRAPYRAWGLKGIDLGDLYLEYTGPGDYDRPSRIAGEAIIEAAHAFWADRKLELMAEHGLVDDEDELEAA